MKNWWHEILHEKCNATIGRMRGTLGNRQIIEMHQTAARQSAVRLSNLMISIRLSRHHFLFASLFTPFFNLAEHRASFATSIAHFE